MTHCKFTHFVGFVLVILGMACFVHRASAQGVNGGLIYGNTIPTAALKATGTATSGYVPESNGSGSFVWSLIQGFAPQSAIAPDYVALSDAANVVTASPYYIDNPNVEPNGQVYEWQAYSIWPSTITMTGAGTGGCNGAYTQCSGGSAYGVSVPYTTPNYTNGTYFLTFDGTYWYISTALTGGSNMYINYSGSGETSYDGLYTAENGSTPPPTATSSGSLWGGPDGTTNTYWTGPVLVTGNGDVPPLSSVSPMEFRCRALGDYTSGGTPPSLTGWTTSSSISYSSTGTGTVTTFSAGNLSPLFTSSVATSTTTPVISYSLSNASANTIFAGPSSGSAAAPLFRSLVAADLPTVSGLSTGSYVFPTISVDAYGRITSAASGGLALYNGSTNLGSIYSSLSFPGCSESVSGGAAVITVPSVDATTTSNSGLVAAGGYLTVTHSSDTASPFLRRVSAYSYMDYTSSLQGYWPFSEGSGTTTADSTGNGNTGTRGGSTLPSWTTSGKYGDALVFNGANHVDCGSGSDLNITGAITVSAWVYQSSTPAYGIILGNLASNGYSGYFLSASNAGSGKPYFQTGYGSTQRQVQSSTALTNNAWNMVTATWDGSVTATIYVNGTSAGTASWGSTATASSSNHFWIGDWVGTPNTYGFVGTIDDAHVYNRCLTAADVSSLYNQTAVYYQLQIGSEILNTSNCIGIQYGDHNGNNVAADTTFWNNYSSPVELEAVVDIL